MTRKICSAILFSIGLAAFTFSMVGTLAAQEVSVLRGHETEKPIDIVAERLEVRDRENIEFKAGRAGSFGLERKRHLRPLLTAERNERGNH